MADSDTSTGIVAVLVIFVVIVVGGLFAYRSGMLDEGGGRNDVDVQIEAPTGGGGGGDAAPAGGAEDAAPAGGGQR